jgi:hypothetical protein
MCSRYCLQGASPTKSMNMILGESVGFYGSTVSGGSSQPTIHANRAGSRRPVVGST